MGVKICQLPATLKGSGFLAGFYKHPQLALKLNGANN